MRSAGRPPQIASGQQVEVKMPHRLSALLAAVGHNAEALFQLFAPGNFSDHLIDMRDDGAVFRVISAAEPMCRLGMTTA